MDKTKIVSRTAVGTVAIGFAAFSLAGCQSPPPHLSPTATPSAPAKTWLVPDLAFRIDADTGSRESTYQFTVTNFGLTSITITSIGKSGPGLELLEGRANPATVGPQERTRILVKFRVTDCDKVNSEPWPLLVRFTAGGLSSLQYLHLMGASPSVPWQKAISEAICSPNSATIHP